MKIVVAGGTGFIGRSLCTDLAAHGHEVVVLSRFSGGTYQGVRHVRAQAVRVAQDAEGRTNATGPQEARYRFEDHAAREIDGADAVINLAGAGIADSRWTPARKAILRESRLSITRALVTALREAATKPSVFVSGSAIGVYGSDLNRTFDESSPAGSDFLAQLCIDWEQAAREAESPACRVVLLRTGLVLARDGGLLAKLKPPFKFFAGGPTGSGKQWMSWIHRDDWIAMVRWALVTEAIRGPLNGVAPNPVINADFAHALGRALHRPSIFPVPAFALRLMFGEMADGAVLTSQKVSPAKAAAGGFTFSYSDVNAALQSCV